MLADILETDMLKIRPAQRSEPSPEDYPADLITSPGDERDCRGQGDIGPQKNSRLIGAAHDDSGENDKNSMQAVNREDPDENPDRRAQRDSVRRAVLKEQADNNSLKFRFQILKPLPGNTFSHFHGIRNASQTSDLNRNP